MVYQGLGKKNCMITHIKPKLLKLFFTDIANFICMKNITGLTLSQTNFRLSRLEQFADNNFSIDENGRKFSKRVENTVGKGEIAVSSNLSYSHSVFLKDLFCKHMKPGLFGKTLTLCFVNILQLFFCFDQFICLAHQFLTFLMANRTNKVLVSPY